MKKLCIICSFLLMSAMCFSQKVMGTFTLPEGEKFISIDWDWSDAVIDKKYNEADWIVVNGKEYWDKAKLEVLSLIVREMNSKMDKSRITVISPESDTKTAYTLYICPIKYSKRGDNVSIYKLKETSSGEEIGSCKLSGDGGSFGSVANLLGDGYEEAARKMGTILKRYNKIK